MHVRTMLVLLLVQASLYAQSTNWVLDQSTITYHMSHPVHEVEGVSHNARGKGICHDDICNFLIAAPVKSFDSGDTNRDLHMLQVTRGAQFPLVVVTAHMPSNAIASSKFECDLDVEFAGKKAHYSHVIVQQTVDGKRHHITAEIPATLRDFAIEPPSFLMMPIKDSIPIRLDLFWIPG